MQQNHARWIAVLNTHLEANARFGGRLTERREHGDPLVCVRSKWLVLWNRMHDGQFCIARAAESQSLLKGGLGWLGEVDGAKNAKRLTQGAAPV